MENEGLTTRNAKICKCIDPARSRCFIRHDCLLESLRHHELVCKRDAATKRHARSAIQTSFICTKASNRYSGGVLGAKFAATRQPKNRARCMRSKLSSTGCRWFECGRVTREQCAICDAWCSRIHLRRLQDASPLHPKLAPTSGRDVFADAFRSETLRPIGIMPVWSTTTE